MKASSSLRLGPVASEILGYLRSHPSAQDTIKGIAQWWLLEQRIRVMTREIQQALDELAAQNLVVAHKDNTGQTWYRLNLSKGREGRKRRSHSL